MEKSQLLNSPYRIVCYNRNGEIISDSIPEFGQMILMNRIGDGKIKEESYIFGSNEDLEFADIPLLDHAKKELESQYMKISKMLYYACIWGKYTLERADLATSDIMRLINNILEDKKED